MRTGGARLFLATSLLALGGAAQGNETITYSYDTLGRLTRVSHAGTVNHGVAADYSYDEADNRTNVRVAAGSSSPPSSSPPPSSGPNRAPTAVDDHGEGRRCHSRDFNVVANDVDPDGDPLTVTAVSGNSGFSILSATEIRYTSPGKVGLFSATYTVSDGRGGSATAVLHVDVPRDTCS